MNAEKPDTKVVAPTNPNKKTNNAMTQSELLPITYNLLKAWGKSWVQGMIDFKTLVQDFNLITKCSNHNRAITFASHLKTALSLLQITLE